MLAYSAVKDEPPPRPLQQSKPVVWVLQGARVGDNAQAHELASLLDAQIVCKHLTFNKLHFVPNLVLGATASTIDAHSRSALAPPWPDLVIATGRRSAPIARWIKKQSQGRTKLVQLGRPRTPLSAFDLIVTTPQYGLPPAPNVIEVPLPFVPSRNIDAQELAAWRREWSGLRRPLIAVAVGSAKFPLRMGRREARLLGQRLNTLAEQMQGSLLLIASPRSRPHLIDRIEMQISAPHLTYRNFDPQKNPYTAALVDCDHLVATSDSISMISELISTGKPVDVFQLPDRALTLKWRASSGILAWLSRNGFLQPPRDVSGFVRTLIDLGLVSAVGKARMRSPIIRDNSAVLERLHLILRG